MTDILNKLKAALAAQLVRGEAMIEISKELAVKIMVTLTEAGIVADKYGYDTFGKEYRALSVKVAKLIKKHDRAAIVPFSALQSESPE